MLGVVQLPCGCGKIQGPAYGEKTQQLVVIHPKKSSFLCRESSVCSQYSMEEAGYKHFLLAWQNFFVSLLLRYILYYLSEERFST